MASDCEWAAKQWGLALPQDMSEGFRAWVKAAASSSKWLDRCKIPDWLKYGATFASRTVVAAHSRILHGSVNDADQRVVGTM